MAKKAELEWHAREYERHAGAARLAEREGLYEQVVKAALEAWPHIDGMMQYEKKYNSREFSSIPTIGMVLRYAPLLLDAESLDRVECLLKERKRIDKNTSVSLSDALSAARRRLWDAHRLWDRLEWEGEQRQDELQRTFGGNQDEWRALAEAWERMGLVARQPEGSSYRVGLQTRFGAIFSGKCPQCGDHVEAPKAMFLEQMKCPHCNQTAMFTIIAAESSKDQGE
jgi:hypothetical protein